MDNLVSVEVMLYNGTITTTSKTENADLFWVIQGAGSSYGILLTLTTKTWRPTYDQLTNFTITLPTDSSSSTEPANGINALLAIQDFVISGKGPDELSLRWSLTAPPFTGSGFYYGDPTSFPAVLAPLMAPLPKTTTLTTAVASFGEMENISTPSIASEIDPYPPRNFYLQALILRTDGLFTYDSASQLYSSTTCAFNRTDMTKFGFIDLWGGVSRDVEDGDAAFAHADSLFLVRWEGRLAAGLSEFPEDGTAYLQSGLRPFEEQLAAKGIPLRGFINYRDTELSEEQWSERLYGGGGEWASNQLEISLLHKLCNAIFTER